MTHHDRLAIRRALETADFSRSPGLEQRLRRSLRHPPEHRMLLALAFSVALWVLAGWLLFGN
jgi:hypothetical protein